MIPIKGRVPTRLAVANAVGSIAYGVKDNGFSTFLLLFYNQVLGMEARLVSFALLVALVFDGFLDPVIGHLSDSTRTRWGRRLPWLYLAGVPLGVAWYVLWTPSGTPSFLVLVASAVIVRGLVACVEVPSNALVPEITRDYDERTRLVRYRYLFGWAGGLLMLMLAYQVFLPADMLGTTGYRNFGLTGAILITGTVLLSALFQHRYVAVPPPPRAAGEHKRLGSAFSDIRECVTHPAFVVLLVAIALGYISQGITFSISNYLYLYVWRFSPLAFQLYPWLLFASVVGAFLFVGPLQRRWGKRGVAIGSGLVGMALWVLPLTLRNYVIPPGSGVAGATLALLFAFILASNMASVIAMISISSMVPDVVEASEEQTGRRSEGTFTAGGLFASKCATGIGIFATGLILEYAGMPGKATPGSVAPQIIDRLTMTYAVILLVLAIVQATVLRRFPISRDDHIARLAALDAAARADPDATGAHP
ncbi:MFS transporter [Novosphingobium tardum]|uniref:MFS transporter n=1 Tax=Novosphingobium tardum TaxID=1538021 RepID=A0ABV8RQQ6_9SPHN